MLKKKLALSCLVYAAAFTVALAGNDVCKKAASCPMQPAARKLEHGGSYFMISDFSMFKPQLNHMLQQLGKGIPAESQMQYQQVIAILGMVCDFSGVSDFKYIGQSSSLLAPAVEGRTAVYHNRLVITSDPQKKLPLIFQIGNGDKCKLQDFAAAIPDNVLQACVWNLDLVCIYEALQKRNLINDDLIAKFKQEFGCTPETLAKALSGRMLMLVMACEPENFSIAVEINDQDNLLFKFICKTLGKDPATTMKIDLTEQNIPVVIMQKMHGIMFLLGKGTGEAIQKKINAGETMAKNPAFKIFAQKLPAEAHGYSIYCQDFNDRKLSMVSALVVNKNGIEGYFNGYYDWNGMPVAMVLQVVNEFQKNGGLKLLENIFKSIP